ncbi:MAG TPA: septal ring lytic transglycosylase RlpA family protein [Fibrobacteria bacterium]|nr:septal ring lytic transglycosylase RlpA family protein [Fibrobacteria bacterium]
MRTGLDPRAILRWSWPLLLCSCAANFPVRTGYDRAIGTWRTSRSAGSSDTSGREPAGTVLTGQASFYGAELSGHPTSSGENFDPSDHTCAHRTLPFGTRLKVTYTKKGTSTVVRVNDRGPHVPDRILDLSRAAADDLGLTVDGVGTVQAEVLP